MPKDGANIREKLLKAANMHIKPFLDQNKKPYAEVDWKGKNEICSIPSRKLSSYLMVIGKTELELVPNKTIIADIEEMFASEAIADGTVYPLYNRIAPDGDDIIYNLGGGRAVLISRYDCLIVEKSPTRFRPNDRSHPQIDPDLDSNDAMALLKYVNIPDEKQRLIFLVAVVSCFIPTIQHPVIVLFGHKGSAKTTTARVLKRIVDPSVEQPSSMLGSQYDLGLHISHSHMISYDNLDHLKNWQSDMLCQAVTGGSVAKRENYTDDSIFTVSFRGCVVLNGINLIATRPDLLDRSLLFELQRIAPDRRRQDKEFWQEFEWELPRILGGLFNTLSKAMELYPAIECREFPRMADFYRWGCAIAQALGYLQEEFKLAFEQNAIFASDYAVRSNPVSNALKLLMDGCEVWKGHMSELHQALERIATIHRFERDHRWPKSANKLWYRIKEVIPDLEVCGITVTEPSRKNTGTEVTIESRVCGEQMR